jgi:hypothetical protein
MASYPELTPNQINDIPTRIRHAKEFLQENPNEIAITAARIYNIQPQTLNSSIKRAPTSGIRGGLNKVLQDHHKVALHLFIQSLLAYGIQPTYQLVYNSICHLKRAQDPEYKAPSLGWFSGWWKANNLHQIKSKPLAVIRLTAQHEQNVQRWFKKYRATLREYKIQRKNIVNFNEAGFRVGCAKGQWILVPLDILEVGSLLFFKK